MTVEWLRPISRPTRDTPPAALMMDSISIHECCFKQHEGVKPNVCGSVPSPNQLGHNRAMSDPTSLGRRIRTLREQAGLKQADLSAAIGISRTHLTNIERDKGRPGREVLVAIAAEVRVSLDWLAEGRGDARPAKATTEDEAMLLFAFRQLPELEGKALLAYVLTRVERDG